MLAGSKAMVSACMIDSSITVVKFIASDLESSETYQRKEISSVSNGTGYPITEQRHH